MGMDKLSEYECRLRSKDVLGLNPGAPHHRSRKKCAESRVINLLNLPRPEGFPDTWTVRDWNTLGCLPSVESVPRRREKLHWVQCCRTPLIKK